MKRQALLSNRPGPATSGAREKLIEKLLPLVGSYARRFPTEGLDQTDLLQEGIVGLLRALDRYDPARGVPVPAYATWWIRRSLQDAAAIHPPVPSPPKALQQLSRLKSEHQRIYQFEHRSAGLAELAERTKIDPDQAAALASADARVRSLDETSDGSDGELGSTRRPPRRPALSRRLRGSDRQRRRRAALRAALRLPTVNAMSSVPASASTVTPKSSSRSPDASG